jgi:hypothetical protein
MTDTDDKVGLTVRITVKLRPDEYDELFRQFAACGLVVSAQAPLSERKPSPWQASMRAPALARFGKRMRT